MVGGRGVGCLTEEGAIEAVLHKGTDRGDGTGRDVAAAQQLASTRATPLGFTNANKGPALSAAAARRKGVLSPKQGEPSACTSGW
jgi:hypothetical protein